jgi:hypothetical protein
MNGMSRRPVSWLLVVGVCILALAGCGPKGPDVEGTYVHSDYDWRFELRAGRFVVYSDGQRSNQEASYRVEGDRVVIEWDAGGTEEFLLTGEGALYGPMHHPEDRRNTYRKLEP